jgi:DNA (cytosine-5)-methyltransferase 1
VDISKINHLSLCSGYGGIDLGLQRAMGDRVRTVAYAEIEAFACELLLTRMENGQLDEAPIWPDLRSFPWEEFVGRVSVISGGYPCQPFSTAGRRQGTDDPRHIWPFIRDGIAIVRPTMCFFENVEGHISMGLSDVVEDLVGMGYRVSWGVFSAAEVGAPHQRKRVFILAHNNQQRLEGVLFGESHGQEGWQGQGGSAPRCSEDCGGEQQCLANSNCARGRENRESGESRSIGTLQSSCDCGSVFEREDGEEQIWPSRPGNPQHSWEPSRVVGNASEQGFSVSGGQSRPLDESRPQSEPERSDEGVGNAEDRDGGNPLPIRPGKKQHRGASGGECKGRQQAQPTLGGNVDGIAGGMDYADLCVTCDNRTDELRLLGNGVVPAAAERAFRVLFEKLTG